MVFWIQVLFLCGGIMGFGFHTLEMWNFVENKTLSLPAHDNLISSLAVSNYMSMFELHYIA
ncbi:hypothetical protein Lal_00006125 [Lupinus albus]|nr:hypothetical protein Lal_00006125 [Lupinus albus]